jgi:hypothetical protein
VWQPFVFLTDKLYNIYGYRVTYEGLRLPRLYQTFRTVLLFSILEPRKEPLTVVCGYVWFNYCGSVSLLIIGFVYIVVNVSNHSFGKNFQRLLLEIAEKR